MVYPSPEGRDSALERAFQRLRDAGELFRGPRSFAFWHIAVAYSLLPAAENVAAVQSRRRVYRLPTGRWSVVQTARTSRYRRCGPRAGGGWFCRPWDCDRTAECLLPNGDDA